MKLKHILNGLSIVSLLSVSNSAFAQTDKNDTGSSIINTLTFETRFDFDYQSYEDEDDKGGFKGKYVNLIMAGDITDNISYNYRQRILPHNGSKTFFDGTDWLYMTYKFNDNWALSAGKQVFLIGGIEYDKAPINVYYWSDFWNNVRCYQMGATLTYTDDSKRHNLSLQVSNSNYTDDVSANLYAYNLIWYGSFKHLQTIYSANMIEYVKGHYINYLALGNKFTFDNFGFYVDFMNRAIGEQRNFLFDDYSLIGRADWKINDKWNVFVKGGYDTNESSDALTSVLPVGGMTAPSGNNDIFVLPGTEYHYYGGGAEFFPLANRDVRLHSFVAVKNAGEDELQFNVGLTWRIDLLKQLKNILK